MVWSLAKERLIPARFAKTNFRGVPVWAVLFSMAGSLLALLSSVIAASTVYLVLVAVSGLATLVVWFSVCVCATSGSGANGRGMDTAPTSSAIARPVFLYCRGWPS